MSPHLLLLILMISISNGLAKPVGDDSNDIKAKADHDELLYKELPGCNHHEVTN